MPFYACRKGRKPLQCERKKPNGKPLRRTGDLSFFKLAPFPTENSELDDCIYEVQTSILVTGVDHWSWTAYGFIDTYYKNTQTGTWSSDQESTMNQESVEYYTEQCVVGVSPDPLTAGQYDAEPPVWTPREYFLRVLESRVKQVNREWHNTVFRVLRRFESQVS